LVPWQQIQGQCCCLQMRNVLTGSRT
jgi:hypothetical protein